MSAWPRKDKDYGWNQALSAGSGSMTRLRVAGRSWPLRRRGVRDSAAEGCASRAACRLSARPRAHRVPRLFRRQAVRRGAAPAGGDRKSVVEGKSVVGGGDRGGRRILKKKKEKK